MIVIRLKGGMGNQMFQYAFGRSQAHKLNTDLILDLSTLLDRSRGDFVYRNYDLSIFNLKTKFLVNPAFLKLAYRSKSRKVTKVIQSVIDSGRNYTKEKHFQVVPEVILNPTKNTIYEGWWQSEQYFDVISDEIRNDFNFRTPILDKSRSLFEKIKNTNAICLNVRRTDFLKVSALNSTDLDYFKRAVKYIEERVSDPSFFIFSDDIEWCEQHIKLDHPTTIVSHEMKGEKFGNYLQLMKACKHFIIPNSSFAWWAAWLNENTNKVIVAPKKWSADPNINTSDITPKSWIRI